ncbi:MAG: hypothetical protein ACE5JL_01680 [Dehalococcoidia bacterium]
MRGEIDDAFIKKEVDKLNRQKTGLEAELVTIQRQKLELASLDEVGDQVKEFCTRIAEKLDEFSFEEKRLALNALRIRVVVGRSGVKLFGVIPQSYATIGQTWGCMFKSDQKHLAVPFRIAAPLRQRDSKRSHAKAR